MSPTATVLDGVTRVPSVSNVSERLTNACVAAVSEHVAIDVDGLRVVPDTLAVELRANRVNPPLTARLSWPDDHDDEDLRGRSVAVYCLPDPRPPHPERMPAY